MGIIADRKRKQKLAAVVAAALLAGGGAAVVTHQAAPQQPPTAVVAPVRPSRPIEQNPKTGNPVSGPMRVVHTPVVLDKPGMVLRDTIVEGPGQGAYDPNTDDQHRKRGPSGISVTARDCKIINCVVKSWSGQGISAFAGATGLEVYGTIISNVGHSKFEHGFYVNGPGPRIFANNIVFDVSSLCFTAHSASGDSPPSGYTLDSNAFYNAGGYAGKPGYGKSARPVDFGQAKRVMDFVVTNNLIGGSQFTPLAMVVGGGSTAQFRGNQFAGIVKADPGTLAQVRGQTLGGPYIRAFQNKYAPNRYHLHFANVGNTVALSDVNGLPQSGAYRAYLPQDYPTKVLAQGNLGSGARVPVVQGYGALVVEVQ